MLIDSTGGTLQKERVFLHGYSVLSQKVCSTNTFTSVCLTLALHSGQQQSAVFFSTSPPPQAPSFVLQRSTFHEKFSPAPWISSTSQGNFSAIHLSIAMPSNKVFSPKREEGALSQPLVEWILTFVIPIIFVVLFFLIN